MTRNLDADLSSVPLGGSVLLLREQSHRADTRVSRVSHYLCDTGIQAGNTVLPSCVQSELRVVIAICKN